ncbi:hypothetical protein [Dactylococcopsis salina]|uniref:Uncharacterized protein n=1 Tax=Dactylococcopsis salina (strain PCC 8305) TaxID=13035 RepID=K9YUY8_DACS8|nr:hypothetical protein [Dactylococcopsis salina]AFZ49938.1 hypothetical protein Dacsa_1241 [Dactylococcopsis salina PCC 8305]
MFEQFRRHFPQGSLLSELVQIDHGKYIVRASVQNAGLTLATGLAAADTVEKAEDEARERALAVLDIYLTSTKTPPRNETTPPSSRNLNSFTPTAIVEPELNQSSVTPETATPKETSNLSSDNAVSPSREKPKPETATPKETSNSSSDNAVSPSREKPKPETVTSKETSNSSSDNAVSPSREKPKPETVTPKETSNSSSELSSHSVPSSHQEDKTMMDSSDIIARTNVELRRLNWTSEQGRKFLGETYGKRSRSLLSDAELLEFLEYLEKQPTPPQNNDQST